MFEFPIKTLALFIDMENIHSDDFDLEKLIKDLKKRGRVILIRSYADWGRYHKVKEKMMLAGVELIEMPAVTQSGKNGSDIKLAIDVMDTVHTNSDIDTYVLVTGDSDFNPLVMNLRAKNRYVIVVSGPDNTSRVLQGCCDEFLDISEYRGVMLNSTGLQDAYTLLQQTVAELKQRRSEVLSSMVKSRMLQLQPTFRELQFGFKQFRQFLQQAEKDGIVHLEKRKEGEYKVVLAQSPVHATPVVVGISESHNGQPTEDGEPDYDHLINVLVNGVALSRNGDRKTTLNELARLCKRLAGDLPPQQFGVAEEEGFKGLVRLLQTEGFLDMEETHQINCPTISLTEKGETYFQETPKDDRYIELEYQTCLENSPFPARLQHVKALHKTLRTFLGDPKQTEPTVAQFLELADSSINTIARKNMEDLLQAMITCEVVQMQQEESFQWEEGVLSDLVPFGSALERVIRHQYQFLTNELDDPIRDDLFRNVLIKENRHNKLIENFEVFLTELDLSQ